MSETTPGYREPDQILAMVAEARAEARAARESSARLEQRVETLCRLVERYRLQQRYVSAKQREEVTLE